MTRDPIDIAASVSARLRKIAASSQENFERLLERYVMERFLRRVAASAVHDRFILKGAALMGALSSEQPYRATRDLDFLRHGSAGEAAIRRDIELICATSVEPDGLVFLTSEMKFEPMQAPDEYVGTRVSLPTTCGRARISLQLDLGLGDDVPDPRFVNYPTLLEQTTPLVLAYPLEAVIAEKLEAVVSLGMRNSRIKDFFDIHHYSTRFAFDRQSLRAAARRTFTRRKTPFPDSEPIALTERYWADPSRPTQVKAFARRHGLPVPQDPSPLLLPVLRSFLLPLLEDLSTESTVQATWPAGGPWG